jgi:hypothetical protein
MSSETRPFDSPPCPACGGDVVTIETENSDPYYSAEMLTLAGFAKHTYTLRPCGHDVAGFTATAERVLEWRLT